MFLDIKFYNLIVKIIIYIYILIFLLKNLFYFQKFLDIPSQSIVRTISSGGFDVNFGVQCYSFYLENNMFYLMYYTRGFLANF